MQIVRLDRGIFFIDNFAGVQNDATVDRAVIDELIKRLPFVFVLFQFQTADLGVRRSSDKSKTGPARRTIAVGNTSET